MDYSLLDNFVQLLVKRAYKVATAESCTGGLIAATLTEIPGISAYFDRGFVTYSNESKIDMLGIQQSLIDLYGAVSKETAVEMAKGALNNSIADVTVAVTGIAGPKGGTPEKPVGTVYIAVATKEHIEYERFNFKGNRNQIREQVCEAAFKMLLRTV